MDSMNKTVTVVAGIAAVACLIGFYIWSSHNRYYITAGPKGVYEVDSKTGESWLLSGGHKIAQEGDGESHEKEQELPHAEASKITGNADTDFQSWIRSFQFSGKLHNGSDWTVTRVIVGLESKNVNGTVLWARDFSAPVTIKPLTVASFSFDVVDPLYSGTSWTIKTVYGYRK